MSQDHHLQRQLEAAQTRIQRLVADLDAAGQAQVQLQGQLDQQQRYIIQLEEQTKRLQRIINTSPATTYTCQTAPPYPCTDVSQSLETVLGYSPDDFKAEPNFWAQHLHPDDAPGVLAAIPKLFEQGELQRDYRVRHRDGHDVWIRDVLVLLRDAQGSPQEVVGYFTDISDQKRLDAERQQNETQLKRQLAAIEAAIDGIGITQDNILVYLNRAQVDLFGYAQAEELLL